MKVSGEYCKDGRLWPICIPHLNVFTQGKTKRDAFDMMKDAIRSLMDDANFELEIEDIGRGEFLLSANDPAKFLAFALKQRRLSSDLTHEEIRVILGAKSRSEFATYEKGATDPTLAKAEKLLSVMGLELAVVGKKATNKRTLKRA